MIEHVPLRTNIRRPAPGGGPGDGNAPAELPQVFRPVKSLRVTPNPSQPRDQLGPHPGDPPAEG